MVKRSEIVAAARALIGTPFRHLGRQPGKELDCVGVLISVGRACGAEVPDEQGYTERPTGVELLRELRSRFREIAPAQAREGSLLAFRIGRRTTHVGISTGEGIVHAYNRCARVRGGETLSRVREERLGERWGPRVTHAFDWPGVEDG